MSAIVKRSDNQIETAVQLPEIQNKFRQLLGDRGNQFLGSLLSASVLNKDLAECPAESVINAALIAASINMPINQSLGFCYIIAYKDRNGVKMAQFQMGWKGLVQLCIRSGQYESIWVTEVYEGEGRWNRFTGKFEQTGEKVSNKIVGYLAHFQLLSGFKSSLYMSEDEIETHALAYSQSYKYQKSSSIWAKNRAAMGKKTVLKLLLSRFGIMSVEMEKAVIADQSVVRADGSIHYDDNSGDVALVEIDRALPFRAEIGTLETAEQFNAFLQAHKDLQNGVKKAVWAAVMKQAETVGGLVFDKDSKRFNAIEKQAPPAPAAIQEPAPANDPVRKLPNFTPGMKNDDIAHALGYKDVWRLQADLTKFSGYKFNGKTALDTWNECKKMLTVQQGLTEPPVESREPGSDDFDEPDWGGIQKAA